MRCAGTVPDDIRSRGQIDEGVAKAINLEEDEILLGSFTIFAETHNDHIVEGGREIIAA